MIFLHYEVITLIYISKRKLIHILLSSSKDFSVLLPSLSSVDLMLSHTVVSVSFFLVSSVLFLSMMCYYHSESREKCSASLHLALLLLISMVSRQYPYVLLLWFESLFVLLKLILMFWFTQITGLSNVLVISFYFPNHWSKQDYTDIYVSLY